MRATILFLMLTFLLSCKSVINPPADIVIFIDENAAKPLQLAAEDLKADLDSVVDANIVIANSAKNTSQDLTTAEYYFYVGQLSKLSDSPLITDQDRQTVMNLNPDARASLMHKGLYQNKPLIMLSGKDIQGTQYAVYDYSKQMLGVDGLEYWTGKKPVSLPLAQLTDFENVLIPAPVVPLLVYFENDVDELANLKLPVLEYDWESFTEMIDSLVRLKYNGIEFFDMLGRAEFYTRPEYLIAHPGYQLDVDYLERMMDYVHDKGMLIQVDMMQGRQLRTLSEAASTCWSDHKQEWIDGWRYYLTETPIKKIDIFSLRPRNQVWDWEYKSTCGEDKSAVFNEVYVEFNKIINEFKPDAPRVCICYHDGMEMFNGDFSPPKDFIIAWSDNGFGGFKYLPEDTKGYKFGTYMHAGFWLNHDVMDPYPELVDSVMTDMFERYDARHYMEVNGQTFRPFLLNIEAYAAFAEQGTAFDGEQFYIDWSTRYFGAEAAAEAVEAMKLLHQANKDRVGYVEILWQIKNMQAYLAGIPVRRPGREEFVVEFAKIQPFFEGTQPRIDNLKQAIGYTEKAKVKLLGAEEFFHDHIELPIRIYLDLLEYNQTLIDLVILSEQNKAQPNQIIQKNIAALVNLGAEQLEQIYQRRLVGDNNPKWAGWYEPAMRRPNNGFPTKEDFEKIAQALAK